MTSKNRHILFVCTEDWFFRSHFLPLLKAAHASATPQQTIKMSLLCNTDNAHQELTEHGLAIHQVDFSRKSKNPLRALRLVWQLAKYFRQEKPDIIHFIALKPVLTGGLAGLFAPSVPKIYHVTGLGTLAEGTSQKAALARKAVFSFVTFLTRRPQGWLCVENPDDLTFLQDFGAVPKSRVTLLGGAGVNPDIFRQLPLPQNKKLHIGYVGRMIWTKGVDILVAACRQLHEEGISIQLDLYGEPDSGNPKLLSKTQLEQWNALPFVSWHGRTSDIEAVWQKADIAVVPTRTREGMPRAMLEAASFGRPLVVSDIPGCRHFVRDGIEGFIVPPEDAKALATAIACLAKDPALRKKMAKAARARVLDGYTEDDIINQVGQLYHQLAP